MRSGLIAIGILLILAQQASGVAIGVNQASITFDEVLRGGYAQAELVITTDSVDPIGGSVLLGESEAAEWLNFSALNFSFSRDEPYRLLVDVQPPSDARIQQYRVNMSILTGELTRSEGGRIGTTTRASLGVPIFLSMTGTERAACRVGALAVLDTERGQPLEVQLTIVNTGNVRVNPDVRIEIFDKLRSQSLAEQSTQFGTSVLPTITQQGYVTYQIEVPRDQYWASVHVPLCEYENLYTFDVLDPGEVKDDGELIRIEAPSWSEVGDIIPINAVFRNRGVRSVRANLRGTIKRVDNDQIVKVIDSETYIIDPSLTANIETFFNPTETGQYVVAGKVFYNEKLTAEKSAILNVNTQGAWSTGLTGKRILLILLFAIITLLLLLLIRKKRQRRVHYSQPHRTHTRIVRR